MKKHVIGLNKKIIECDEKLFKKLLKFETYKECDVNGKLAIVVEEMTVEKQILLLKHTIEEIKIENERLKLDVDLYRNDKTGQEVVKDKK